MLIHRVGTFLMFLGVTLIGLFVMSDIARTPSCGFLVYGVISLGLGIYLWFRDPVKPGPPSGRFRLFKMTGKKQDQKNEKPT